MKGKKLLSRAAFIALMATAPSVFAQSYVPSVGVPTPTSIKDYERCDEIMVGVYDTKTYKACLDGQEQARYTAEQFSLTNGKVHGYLEGFSYALYQATNANDSDAEEMARGRAALDANGGQMQAGLQHGIDQGNKHGGSAGSSDALGIWEDAFQRGQLPAGGSSDNYDLSNIPNYNPNIADPYDRFVGRKTVQDIMRTDISDNLREVVVGIQNQQIFLVDRVNYSLWDLWFDNGRYDIQRYKNGRWVNPAESFKFWNENTERLGQFDINSYSNLPSSYQDTVATTTVTNPDGTTSNVPMTINLKQTFKDGFLASYQYYMHHNFNKGFHEFLKLGASAGEMTGIQVGKRVAFENGYAGAYNELFNKEAQRTYKDAYTNSYMNSFDAKFNDYANSAKLTITKVEAEGEVQDGILSPGERFRVIVKVQNKGGQDASNLRVNLTGDISGSASQPLSTLRKLSADTYTTDFIAQIRAGHDVSQDAVIRVSLTGDNGASATSAPRLDIQNQVESKGKALAQNIDAIQGSAIVSLPIQNVSEVDTPDLTAEVVIGGVTKGSEFLGKLVPGERREVQVRVSDLNQLKLIDGLNAKLVIKTDGKEISGATGSTQIKTGNATKAITEIFAKLAKNERVGEISLDDARAKLLTLNGQQTRANRKGQNVYKSQPSLTIPGSLVNLKGSTSDSTALEEYNSVAVAMWKNHRKNLPGFLSGKRKAFRKLLDQLTIVGKVKKAAKGKR